MRIVHLSTLHPRADPRIFHKEAVSAADAFVGEVGFVVADGQGDALTDGVQIIDLGKTGGGRLRRFVIGSVRAFRQVRKINPKLVHFHDPELMFTGLALKLTGTKVIYDVHEDLPRHILQKPYIARPFRRPLSITMEALEGFAAFCFDAVVTVTPHIAKRFSSKKTVLVANFAALENSIDISDKGAISPRTSRPTFIYSGNITRERGIFDMLDALAMLDDINPKLILAGKFNEPGAEVLARAHPAWTYVEFTGWVSKDRVHHLLRSSDIGLSVLHSTPSYDHAYPTKIFEYMKFGLPTIGSALPTTIDIVKDSGAGIIVPPNDPAALAGAMRKLASDKTAQNRMGEAARATFETTYNWDAQAQKLIALYQRLL